MSKYIDKLNGKDTSAELTPEQNDSTEAINSSNEELVKLNIAIKIYNDSPKILNDRMAMLGNYWNHRWSLTPLYPNKYAYYDKRLKKNIFRSGKEPVGYGWQKRVYTESEFATLMYKNSSYNVGIKHCVNEEGKLCTIGIDLDGEVFFTQENLLNQLELLPQSFWRDEMIRIFKYSALMQSSPTHKHILVSIDIPIRKIILNHSEGDKLEILGKGNQSAIPPSICSKPNNYDDFLRYWIDGRNEILHISNETLEQFVQWVVSVCPEEEKSQTFKLRKVRDNKNYKTENYAGEIELTREKFDKYVNFFLGLSVYPDRGSGTHSYHFQFVGIIMWLTYSNIIEKQIREIVQIVADDVNSYQNHQNTISRLIAGNYRSKDYLIDVIKRF